MPVILGGRYVLAEAKPRKGGMAEVHRAADTQDALKAVAIKYMIGSRIHDDRILAEAFSRELTALNSLNHPNIVRILDFDARHDPPYMVLEWLERDLVAHLESTHLEGWDAFYSQIGGPVLEGLVYALTKGVVHRDLKPANILVDDNGTPKIADFGISKFYHQGPAGLTLAAYKTEPYAPFDEPFSPQARDPYSFAVLALECLTARVAATHEDVASALTQCAVPSEVRAILSHALDKDPSARFPSILELHAAFDDLQKADHRQSGEQAPCYVFIFPQAISRLCQLLNDNNERRVQRLLEQDIVESCSLFFWQERDGKKHSTQFLCRTSQFRVHLGVSDRGGDSLVLLNAWPEDSDAHAAHSEFGFRPKIPFRFGRPPVSVDGAAVVRWLVEAVKQHELADAAARRDQRKEEILQEWSNTLRFRQRLEDERFAAVSYDGYRIDGNRVIFKVASIPDDLGIDEPRLVRKENRVIVAGVVDEIAAGEVVLWMGERGVSESPPERGQLIMDNRAARVAIERQKAALDAVRYGRCLRPSLRDLILDPSQARLPQPLLDIAWIQEQFDDDKKAAVAKALTAEDVLVVQGPPGTGKTRFITELVAQLLKRDPDCKILLTSQTHVALDNALERLLDLNPGARILRVAQRDDGRVSPKVRALTIDRVAERWRSELAKASETFLSSVAKDLGVRREDIALGIAAGRMKVESAELDGIESKIRECEGMLADAEQKLAEAQVGRVADSYQETSESLDELREQLRELQERRKVVGARRREAAKALAATGELGSQLSAAGTNDLAEWENGLLNGSEADRKYHTLIRLAEQWQLEFAGSREFYSAMVAASSVVAGTCLGFARIAGMMAAEFDVCIVDEASKATATELMVPLSRAKRWILVGDTRQLPPFVEDLLDDTKLLDDYDLDRESFQRTLLDRFAEGLPAPCIASLTTQHRMCQPIGDLVSACFYDGALKSVRPADGKLRVAMPAAVTWITTANMARREESQFDGTFKNIGEARVVGQWLRRLDFVAKAAGTTLRVAVITGYVGQLAELRRTVAPLEEEGSALSIECNTVDAFQGREADVCVYSVSRCNDRGEIGFLRDARRMNVALSRGRDGLVIVGDHLFCRTARNPNPLGAVVEYIEGHPGDCTIVEAVT